MASHGEIYSILLAAALHDVRHPGTNNNYQVNRMTEWSMIYNDNSVLENMHAIRAWYLLVGSEDGSDGDFNGGGDAVLGTITMEQRRTIQTGVTRSILYTDMSRHFSEVAKIARHVDALEDEIAEEAGGSSVEEDRGCSAYVSSLSFTCALFPADARVVPVINSSSASSSISSSYSR